MCSIMISINCWKDFIFNLIFDQADSIQINFKSVKFERTFEILGWIVIAKYLHFGWPKTVT